ncbi:MAG: phosphoserine phosphatase [Candidatus Zixiibacteriota bacterium]
MIQRNPQCQSIDTVIFDCDSTLAAIEGVDELAQRAGVGDEIRRLTAAAMDGDTKLEDVYGKRLDLIRPGIDDLAWLGQRYCDSIVEGAREIVARLQESGRTVYVVSGGLQQSLAMLGAELKIPQERVIGVPVLLTEDGKYAGYDTTAPTARSGGKTEVITKLVENGQRAVMVGDGVTDLEAQAVGVPVIGFGGVVTRTIVKTQAEYWVAGPSLLGVLDKIEELERQRRP